MFTNSYNTNQANSDLTITGLNFYWDQRYVSTSITAATLTSAVAHLDCMDNSYDLTNAKTSGDALYGYSEIVTSSKANFKFLISVKNYFNTPYTCSGASCAVCPTFTAVKLVDNTGVYFPVLKVQSPTLLARSGKNYEVHLLDMTTAQQTLTVYP